MQNYTTIIGVIELRIQGIPILLSSRDILLVPALHSSS